MYNYNTFSTNALYLSLFPAVRNATGTARHDGPGTERLGQDHVYPDPYEGNERVCGASQGDAYEPQSHHRPADVWAVGRNHQWLDWRHLLRPVEKDLEDEKGTCWSTKFIKHYRFLETWVLREHCTKYLIGRKRFNPIFEFLFIITHHNLLTEIFHLNFKHLSFLNVLSFRNSRKVPLKKTFNIVTKFINSNQNFLKDCEKILLNKCVWSTDWWLILKTFIIVMFFPQLEPSTGPVWARAYLIFLQSTLVLHRS